MASYHFSIKSGKRGTAAEHAAYIAREGKYARGDGANDLVVKVFGNLPDWADDNPSTQWRYADRGERTNGAAYREIVVALPKEQSHQENLNLVMDFVDQELGEKAYQLAIHAPQAALGKVAQPHAHIMFSDRMPDGIKRSREQHFKRYNPFKPALGGCKKDSGGKDRATLRNNLIALRASWAALQNAHLQKNGHATRVDHRSNKARGIGRKAERHEGQVRIMNMTVEDKESLLAGRQDGQPPA